ncbi:BglG family transcription antiterminator [Listeria ilorinensis]|uniref:BglG family transcription antiterminator n=1 Tax=Listeria ilorinensis TaxID=2867439 RepID=UPI001EF67728|nr:PRD domain-containing protein [Listeria ilorinensis]
MGMQKLQLPRWRALVQQLYMKMDFMSGDELADCLGVSARTIRSDIRLINEVLAQDGNNIESVRGVGYLLAVENEVAIREAILGDQGANANLTIVPMLAEKRVDYIIRLLLLRNDYLKIDEIADELYVSKSTINTEMIDVKKKLAEFKLVLEKRPGYGIRISGEELNIRFCFSKYLLTETADVLISESEQAFFSQIDLHKIEQAVTDSIQKYKIQMTDIAVKNLIIHIAIAVSRVQENCYIAMGDLDNIEFNMQELRAAQNILRLIEQEENIHFPESELSYILLHLSAKHIAKDYDDYRELILVNKMLEHLREQFAIDLTGDSRLLNNLALHLKPAVNRIKFNMNIDNPYLPDLKQNYPLAFELGIASKNVLESELGVSVSEAEAGYIAIHLLYALDGLVPGGKKRVIVVCASGLGTAQLLQTKLRRTFSEQLDIVAVQSLQEYARHQITCDFVIATVPLPDRVHEYVQVSPFLSQADVRNIEEMMTKGAGRLPFQPEEVFSEKLFQIAEPDWNKQTIIARMVELLEKEGICGEDYSASVWERELIVPTYLGNGFAVPHPIKADVKKTAIAVCVAKEGILWNDEEEARLIFMLAVRNKEQTQLTAVYELISDIAEQPKIMRLLRDVTDFQGFLEVVKSLQK